MPLLDKQPTETDSNALPKTFLNFGGYLALGAEKPDNGPGKNLPYFSTRNVPEIADAYGDKPGVIRAMLIGDTPDDVMPGWYENWSNGSTAVRCRGNGHNIVSAQAPDALWQAVRDHIVVRPYTEEDGTAYQVRDVVPCSGSGHALYPRCASCKPIVRLTFVVLHPETDDLVMRQREDESWEPLMYAIKTSSDNNIKRLMEDLERYYQAVGSLKEMEILLKRPAAEVYVPFEKNGKIKQAKNTIYFVEFEVAPKHRAMIASRVLGGGPSMPALTNGTSTTMLPSGQMVNTATGEVVTGDYVDERPYNPVQFKQRFDDVMAKTNKDKTAGSAEQGERGKLTGTLNGFFSDREDPNDCRYKVLKYLTGKTSSKHLSEAEAYYLNKICDNSNAITEIRGIWRHVTDTPVHGSAEEGQLSFEDVEF